MSIQALCWAFKLPIKGTAKAVLLALADHADEQHQCWPSQPRLALYSGLTDRGVRKALDMLESLGLLRRQSVPGRPSVYVLAVGSEAPERPTQERRSGVSEQAPRNHVPPHPGTTFRPPRNDVPDTPEPRSYEPPLTTIEPPVQPTCAHAREDVSLEGFREFWEAYPRKVGKGGARRAWTSARKKASAEVILAALRVYPFPVDRPEYVPHASTWLNQERWTDEIDTRDPVLVAAGLYDDETLTLDLQRLN